MQKSSMTQLSANALNQQIPVRKEQKTTINKVTGKKKIQPKIEKVYEDSNAEVNPHFNPFM